MPLTNEEYKIGQLYTVAKASEKESGGNLAIEILANEPFENEWGRGQYTHKIFHIDGKLPKFVTRLFPSAATKLDEKSWNAFPYCKTELTNKFLGDRFEITVESIYLSNDRGQTENALNLSKEILKKRSVEILNIAKDQIDDDDFASENDPRIFQSKKTNRGPLKESWINDYDGPVMCCYKLVTIKFHVFGLENKVQQYIDRMQRNLFLKLNKQLFCTIDEWVELNVKMIREMEEDVKFILNEKIKSAGPMESPPVALSEVSRIPLPMSVEEFKVAQLYTVGIMSRENTNDDTGVQIIVNEPFTNERGTGQYTHKICKLGSKVPSIVASMVPASMLIMHEKAWNCYPYCRTEYSAPALGDRVSIVVESIHLPDSGTTHNAHNLTPEQLKARKVTLIDIAVDKGSENRPDTDPSKIHSVVSGRGPLLPGWINQTEPIMCCYKLASIKANFSFISGTVESMAERQIFSIFLEFARKTFALTDEWYGLSMDDIRAMEDKIKAELEGKVAANPN